jgi:hypothetical protein
MNIKGGGFCQYFAFFRDKQIETLSCDPSPPPPGSDFSHVEELDSGWGKGVLDEEEIVVVQGGAPPPPS